MPSWSIPTQPTDQPGFDGQRFGMLDRSRGGWASLVRQGVLADRGDRARDVTPDLTARASSATQPTCVVDGAFLDVGWRVWDTVT